MRIDMVGRLSRPLTFDLAGYRHHEGDNRPLPRPADDDEPDPWDGCVPADNPSAWGESLPQPEESDDDSK